MEALDFPEIARLITKSKTTEIDYERPRTGDDGIVVYEARHRVHTASYPFRILYLGSRVQKDALVAAARQLLNSPDVHVVFAPSLEQRVTDVRGQLGAKDGRVWNSREYLASFIRDELSQYTAKLREASPRYYIDPPVQVPAGVKRKIPNPLRSLLLDSAIGDTDRSGTLAVALAEPGQGKTYMSRYLVSEISQSKQNLVPLMIDSSQWSAMSLDDLGSLSKTIAQTFRHFGTPIGWIDGNEEQFLRTTLKADLFRVVFDGFDEYILRNRGAVQPMDALEALAEIASSTGARILITSRTSFWDTNLPPASLDAFVERTGALLYRILPFDVNHAQSYFDKRLGAKSSRAKSAARIYAQLREQSEELTGRGFVLSLVADVVERGEVAEVAGVRGGNAVLWLTDALCQREELRQQLPLNAKQQVRLLRSFACETAVGNDPDSELLLLSLQEVRSDLDEATLSSVMEKLKSHPLIERSPKGDRWQFREEQVGIALLADRILDASQSGLRRFLAQLRLDASRRQDVASVIADLLLLQYGREKSVAKLSDLLRLLTTSEKPGEVSTLLSEPARLASVLALRYIDKTLPAGSERKERAQLLLSLCGGDEVRGLAFTGTIARFDFSDVAFDRCLFERVNWANCVFSDDTTFRHCHFVGAGALLGSSGLGAATTPESTLDEEAATWFEGVRISEGKKRYSVEQLESDVRAVLKRFIVRGGPGLRTVHERDLRKGPIGASRHKDEIIATLTGPVLRTHEVSGATGDGYHIAEEAEEAVRFFAVNNVFTGPLKEAVERLKKKLNL